MNEKFLQETAMDTREIAKKFKNLYSISRPACVADGNFNPRQEASMTEASQDLQEIVVYFSFGIPCEESLHLTYLLGQSNFKEINPTSFVEKKIATGTFTDDSSRTKPFTTLIKLQKSSNIKSSTLNGINWLC